MASGLAPQPSQYGMCREVIGQDPKAWEVLSYEVARLHSCIVGQLCLAGDPKAHTTLDIERVSHPCVITQARTVCG